MDKKWWALLLFYIRYDVSHSKAFTSPVTLKALKAYKDKFHQDTEETTLQSMPDQTLQTDQIKTKIQGKS